MNIYTKKHIIETNIRKASFVKVNNQVYSDTWDKVRNETMNKIFIIIANQLVSHIREQVYFDEAYQYENYYEN
jgi:hypothetical protein